MRTISTATDDKHLDLAYQLEIDADTYFDFRLCLGDEIPEPSPAFAIDGCLVGTKGNFSIISGQPKSRKTFLTSAIVVAVLTGKFGNITSDVSGRVLYIDTEQGKKHCHNVLKRIATASGMIAYDVEDRLFFLTLREQGTESRFKLIEQAVNDMSTTGLEFVVIDGIRDLVYDINNPEESTLIIDKLMEWSAKFDVHIICILHENKGNGQLRGHLGSEGQNKAEAVIHVERVDGNHSKIEPKYTRNKEFLPFALYVSSDGQMSTGELEGKSKPIEFDIELMRGIANGAFKENPVYTSKDSFNAAIRKFYYDCTSKNIGRNKAYDLIDAMQNADIIEIITINPRQNEIRAKGNLHFP